MIYIIMFALSSPLCLVGSVLINGGKGFKSRKTAGAEVADDEEKCVGLAL
jgi:hypothetical protein